MTVKSVIENKARGSFINSHGGVFFYRERYIRLLLLWTLEGPIQLTDTCQFWFEYPKFKRSPLLLAKFDLKKIYTTFIFNWGILRERAQYTHAIFQDFWPSSPFVTQTRTNPYIFTRIRNKSLTPKCVRTLCTLPDQHHGPFLTLVALLDHFRTILGTLLKKRSQNGPKMVQKRY